MNAGTDLHALVTELTRQLETKHDYVVPNGRVEAVVDADGAPRIVFPAVEPMPLTTYAHNQMSQHLAIPKPYYDRMKVEAPALLVNSINVWLNKKPNEERLVRTLDGNVRALLSSAYRPLDNLDLANAVLPRLVESDARVVSAQLTDAHFYIKAILPSLSTAVPVRGQWTRAGLATNEGPERVANIVSAIVVSNSEVGASALRAEPSVFDAFCTNLAIIHAAAMRKYHVGRRIGGGENDEGGDDFTVFRDDTRKADDAAFWLRVRDVIDAAFSSERFLLGIDAIRRAQGMGIVEAPPKNVIEVTLRKLALNEGLTDKVLDALYSRGDMSAWGVASALTFVANTRPDYEDSTDLERAGGRVIDFTDAEWREVIHEGNALEQRALPAPRRTRRTAAAAR